MNPNAGGLQQQIIAQDHHANEPGHELAHTLADIFSWQALLFAAAIGGFLLFRKQINKLTYDELMSAVKLELKLAKSETYTLFLQLIKLTGEL